MARVQRNRSKNDEKTEKSSGEILKNRSKNDEKTEKFQSSGESLGKKAKKEKKEEIEKEFEVEEEFEENEEENEDEEKEFEVEAIVAKRHKRRKIEYRVRWVGYSDKEDTWESPQNLEHCKNLVEVFEAKINSTKKIVKSNENLVEEEKPKRLGKRSQEKMAENSGNEAEKVAEWIPAKMRRLNGINWDSGNGLVMVKVTYGDKEHLVPLRSLLLDGKFDHQLVKILAEKLQEIGESGNPLIVGESGNPSIAGESDNPLIVE